MATRGLFIAGTNTGVGKTHVAAMIARALAASGRRVGVYKPAASGCREAAEGLIADDAVALWEAAGQPLTLAQVCPQRFLAPLAPPRAALAEGRRVDAALLRTGLEPWLAASDVVVVEGAGGLMSPLSLMKVSRKPGESHPKWRGVRPAASAVLMSPPRSRRSCSVLS